MKISYFYIVCDMCMRVVFSNINHPVKAVALASIPASGTSKAFDFKRKSYLPVRQSIPFKGVDGERRS